MSIKRRDTPDNEAYWSFIERTAVEVRSTRPAGPPCTECGRELHDLSVSTVRGLCNRCAPEWAREVIVG